MSGKRKTLSRYKKTKNDTTRKKRTKRSDSRFKRSSNKAITKQIGGASVSIEGNIDKSINTILNYLKETNKDKTNANWKRLRNSDIDKIYGLPYISLYNIREKLTAILNEDNWYYKTFSKYIDTITTVGINEGNIIVNDLLETLNIDKYDIHGIKYVNIQNFSDKLKFHFNSEVDTGEGTPPDTKEKGSDTEWGDVTSDDKEQFTIWVRLCDVRTGEKTNPLELYKKIKEGERDININEITGKMIIDYSRIIAPDRGTGAVSDTGSDAGAEAEYIPEVIDKLKEKSDEISDGDEYKKLYEELRIFHKILEENPDLIDSLLNSYKGYPGGYIEESDKEEYNTKIVVLEFLKSYLDEQPNQNDKLMLKIFLDDYRYVLLMN